MSNLTIACIGKLKEKYWKDAQAEYTKRLSAFCRVSIVEKNEAPLPRDASEVLIQKAQEQEGDALLSAAKGTLIALSPEGEQMDSQRFSTLVKTLSDTGDLTFAIGGSYGLSDAVKKSARHIFSFSDLTMPHQLFRIVLLEQIYRGFMIAAGRTYHK
jgi:23S rRNA (pseudouridine1915-N3)-methyltransferase